MIYDLTPARQVSQALIDDELDKANRNRLYERSRGVTNSGTQQRIVELQSIDMAQRVVYHARTGK